MKLTGRQTGHKFSRFRIPAGGAACASVSSSSIPDLDKPQLEHTFAEYKSGYQDAANAIQHWHSFKVKVTQYGY